MKVNIYTIKDLKAERSIQPFYRDKDEVMIRDFEMSVTSEDNPLGKNPEDYVLLRIGEWDDETNEIYGHQPVHIINGEEAQKNRLARLQAVNNLHAEIKDLENVT